jgi:predicted Zn-dependent protease
VLLRVLPALVGAAVLAGAGGAASPTFAGQAAATASFDDLVRRADGARLAGRLEEAEALYREALKQRPRWPDGWWYLGTMAYERDRPKECVQAFRRLLALRPQTAAGWALRGLCAFQLEEYAAARRHLERALTAGPLEDEAMGRVAAYHQALLLIRDGEFEAALLPLAQLLQTQPRTPELSFACGLALLRRAEVPAETAPADRERVRAVGEAYCAHLAHRTDEAQRRFEELLGVYPRQRHLHYGYGLSLAQAGKAECLAQFEREIELFPDDVLARIELALGLVARGRAAEALAPAEKAKALAPRLFATRYALGRALVETGALERGILELEAAVALAPDIPEMILALARAYARAGRRADAERANQAFQALDRARRSPAGGSPPPSPQRP